MEYWECTTEWYKLINNNDTNNTLTKPDEEGISYFVHFTVACVLLITTVLSIFTNGTVLYIFFVRKRSFLTRVNTYISAVCFLALAMASFGCPMVIASSFAGHWLFGDGGCRYYGFLATFCGISTIYILAIISVDRLGMVAFGLFNGSSNNRFSISAIMGCLCASLMLSILPLFGWNEYKHEGLGTSCSPDIENDDPVSRAYIITLLVLCFIAPLSVLVFCYWRIFAKVMEVRRKIDQQSKTNDTPRSMMKKKNISMEIGLAQTLMYIVGAFLFCWTPYAIILVWSVFNNGAIHPLVSSIPSMMTKTGSCITPLVYLGRNRKMRQVVKDLFSHENKTPTRKPQRDKRFVFVSLSEVKARLQPHQSRTLTLSSKRTTKTLHDISEIYITRHSDSIASANI